VRARRGRMCWLAALAVGLASAPVAAAQAPSPSDDSSGAQQLTPNTIWEYNSGSATEAGEPLTQSTSSYCILGSRLTQLRRTYWWYVTGTGGPISISTWNSGHDSALAVYRPGVTNPTYNDVLTCDDDSGLDQADALVRIESSERGARYLVQAGSCDRYSDDQFATSTPCHSLNDSSALQIGAVTNDRRSEADTVVNVPRSNVGASVDPGEVTSCGGASYGKTVWFAYDAPGTGTLTASASGFDTVLSIYSGDAGSPAACTDGAIPSNPLLERLEHTVTSGRYYLQVGSKNDLQGQVTVELGFNEDLDLDRDGSRRPEDCDDGNAAVKPGAPDVAHNGVNEDCSPDGDNLDADGDGHRATFAGGDDCNDANLHVNPMVADQPNNAVDEDCRGGDAAARLQTSPQVSFLSNRVPGRGRIFGVLRVRNLRAGYTVTVRCRGARTCPKRATKRLRGRRTSVVFRQYFGKILRPGTRVDISVTTAGNVIGFFKRYRVRRRGNPRQTVCELDPGRRAPVRCR
jgi:Putative metal-binding motif